MTEKPRDRIGKTFMRGLLTVLPIALTIGVLWWLGSLAERLLGGLLRFVLPDAIYLPGMGLVAGAAAIYGIGLLMRAWMAQRIIAWAESMLGRVPLVKSVYRSFREFTAFFRQEDEEERLGQPVLLEFQGAQLVGFVTREDADALGVDEHLVVYLPMAYQIGGYMMAVPPDAVRPIEAMNTREAMRYVLTAGISRAEAAAAPDGAGSSGD